MKKQSTLSAKAVFIFMPYSALSQGKYSSTERNNENADWDSKFQSLCACFSAAHFEAEFLCSQETLQVMDTLTMFYNDCYIKGWIASRVLLERTTGQYCREKKGKIQDEEEVKNKEKYVGGKHRAEL